MNNNNENKFFPVEVDEKDEPLFVNIYKLEIESFFKNVPVDKSKIKKYYALMIFETALDLGISNVPNKWVNTKNLYYTKGVDALDSYANFPNPASQLIDATSIDELAKLMFDTLKNMNDESWLNENLYPYL